MDAALAQAHYNPADRYRQSMNFGGNNGAGMTCGVNGQSFMFPDPNPLVMPLGRIVEWGFRNLRGHPLHVHVNPFQLVKFNNELYLNGINPANFYKDGDYYDNLLNPLAAGPAAGQADAAILRFQPGPYSGYSLMHCHFLNHEDLGCMKVVLWQCPGYNTTQPVNGACPGFKWPVPADI
jgi:FtsP/CotA-like multicopper oxidase with cupredoxin domain